MNKLKKRFNVFAIFALFLCFAAPVFAQETKDVKLAEPSYEIVLQVLVASNTGDNNQMPQSLGNVVRKLKTTFPFSDYRLTATYLNRVENGGTIESRGIIQETNASATPTFQNWSIYGVKRVADAGGQNLIQLGTFQFGTKFPIQMGQSVNYDDTGLKINRLNLAENVPTIVGTMNASKTNELIVLVLTVRPSN
ncbi:MAG TPA: hypothetical protein VEQ34_02090 [Pyrinomonadaceae bacterium]|nr:hypothetical protein [Pyrinomonadaceae bacterium]